MDDDFQKCLCGDMDDDFAEISFSQSGGAVVKGDTIVFTIMSVSEDVGAVTVTVTLTHSPVQSVAATLEIKGTATDADDYQVMERNISFGIGERQATLNLVIVDDDLDEPDETIILEAVPQDLKLVGTASTTLTIEDNDVLTINFEQASYVISEGYRHSNIACRSVGGGKNPD